MAADPNNRSDLGVALAALAMLAALLTATARPDTNLTTAELADDLRYTGLALQLLGITLAAYGIRKVRIEWTEQLGIAGAANRHLTGIAQRTRAAWRRLRRKPQTVELQGVAANLSLQWSADITQTIPDPPTSQPIEQRVQWLEQYVRTAFDHAENTRRALVKEANERAAAIAAQQAVNANTTEEIRDSIGRLAGGGLRLQTWGVICLLLGIALATIPGEMADWLT